MLVTENVGNLFESDCTILMHQANCFTTMGAGFAKELKMRHPEAYQADLQFSVPKGSRDRLGRHSFAWSRDHSRLLVNLYGQHRYGRDQKYTEEDKLLEAMEEAFSKLEALQIRRPDFQIKVGMPYGIGCGLAGGDWKIVYEGIERIASKYNVRVCLYRLK